MKIRSGFVSNSSSTSYTVLLPDDFTIDKINWDHEYIKEAIDDNGEDRADVMRYAEEALKDLMKGEEIYEESHGCTVFSVLHWGLEGFVIASAEGGAGGTDTIVRADMAKVLRILNTR